jgi:hypothetical protein
MKRFTLALIVLAVGLAATTSWAEEGTGEENKLAWAENIKVGGYVDVRPSFYWFYPAASNVKEFHASTVRLYETGLNVTAQVGSAVKASVEGSYGQWGIDYRNPLFGDYLAPQINFNFAYLQLGSDNSVWGRFGKYYVPTAGTKVFGMHYNLLQSNLYANPIAVGLGYNHKYFGISAHAWNGNYDLRSSSGVLDNEIIDTYLGALVFHPLAMFDRFELDVGGFFLTDATETWGNLSKYFNATTLNSVGDVVSSVNYDENVFLWGAYLYGKFSIIDLLGLGFRAEYASTTAFDKHDYIDADGEDTVIWFGNAELALLFWDGVLTLGGIYERADGVDYFGVASDQFYGADNPYYKAENGLPKYRSTFYHRYGGFLRTNLMEELSIGLQLTRGADNTGNGDMELQVQTRLDF